MPAYPADKRVDKSTIERLPYNLAGLRRVYAFSMLLHFVSVTRYAFVSWQPLQKAILVSAFLLLQGGGLEEKRHV